VSENLKAFLRAWLDWVEAGAPEDDVFERSCGLCNNFNWYMRNQNVLEFELGGEMDALIEVFKMDGLDETYPFGGEDAYFDEGPNNVMHLNSARLAWVRSKISQHETA
jgi:hypothetical protein